MKTAYLLLFIFTIAILSCSKSDDAPSNTTPPTVIPTPITPARDTLGAGWSKSNVNQNESLTDIFFIGTNGYMGGDTVYHSTDRGISWNKIISPGNVNNLFVTDDKLFLINPSGLHQKNTTSTNFTLAIQAYQYGDIYFTDINNGYFFSGTSLYKTQNGGNTWAPTSIILPNNSTEYATLFFLNSNIGWLGLGEKIYKTDGNSIIAATSTGLTQKIESIYAVSADILFAGSDGKILKSINGGISYNTIINFQARGFTDIHFIDSNIGYACAGNLIYKTSNGGTSWTKVVTLANNIITEIHFTDANHGWACGSNGTVLRYNL